MSTMCWATSSLLFKGEAGLFIMKVVDLPPFIMANERYLRSIARNSLNFAFSLRSIILWQSISVRSSLTWSFLNILINSLSVISFTSNGLLVSPASFSYYVAFLPNLFGLIAFRTFITNEESEESPSAIMGTAIFVRDNLPASASSII